MERRERCRSKVNVSLAGGWWLCEFVPKKHNPINPMGNDVESFLVPNHTAPS